MGKHEKKRRKKALTKGIKGHEKQIEKHEEKIIKKLFRLDTTPRYYKKEQRIFSKEKEKKIEKLKKTKSKKKIRLLFKKTNQIFLIL